MQKLILVTELLLLAEEKNTEEAKKYAATGFRLDPGGCAFQVTEDAYFRRAAMIKSENPEAQMMYGLLLLYVRNNPTMARQYLDEAMILSELEIDSINYLTEEDAKKKPCVNKLKRRKERKKKSYARNVVGAYSQYQN